MTSDDVHYTYDDRGNLTRIHTTGGEVNGTNGQYYYNAKGKMTFSVNKMGITSQYTYDGEGRRVIQAVDASNINVPETSDLYDQELLELLLADENGLILETKKEMNYIIDVTSAYNDVLMIYGKKTKVQRYTYGHGLISLDTWNDKVEDWADINQNKHDVLLYAVEDMLGSVRALVTEEGRVDKYYDYDSFGTPSEKNHVNDQGVRSNIYHYAGYIYDYATSLYFVNARYMTPELGRFISEDPFRGDGLNRYIYVKGNPLVFYDPSGYGGENSSYELSQVLVEIFEDWGLDTDDEVLIAQYLLQEISSKTNNQNGVMISFESLQGTAVLHVAGKEGFAVDTHGNVAYIRGLDIAATLNISGGIGKTYVYYPDYSEVDQAIGNSAYAEITGGVSLISGGVGANNYSGDENYYTITGGFQQSGLPSLNARAIPVDVTMIGISFIWEVEND